jgi:hypothetical protein
MMEAYHAGSEIEAKNVGAPISGSACFKGAKAGFSRSASRGSGGVDTTN